MEAFYMTFLILAILAVITLVYHSKTNTENKFSGIPFTLVIVAMFIAFISFLIINGKHQF
jgi:uncharacterized membrane protein YhaH (DUF805 family)